MKKCYECEKSVSEKVIFDNWERMGDEIVVAFYDRIAVHGPDEMFIEDKLGDERIVVCPECVDRAFREYVEE